MFVCLFVRELLRDRRAECRETLHVVTEWAQKCPNGVQFLIRQIILEIFPFFVKNSAGFWQIWSVTSFVDVMFNVLCEGMTRWRKCLYVTHDVLKCVINEGNPVVMGVSAVMVPNSVIFPWNGLINDGHPSLQPHGSCPLTRATDMISKTVAPWKMVTVFTG